MQIDRVEQRPPDVVLPLPVRAVANPHRPRAFVPRQVVEGSLGKVPLTLDCVHHLEGRFALRHVGDEVEEVVGLSVEAERVREPHSPKVESRIQLYR